MSHASPAPDGAPVPESALPSSLIPLGYDARRHATFLELGPADHAPARVVEEHRDRMVVVTANRRAEATPSGRLRHASTSRDELPAVGDWVVVRGTGDSLQITAVLPRRSSLVRKAAGSTTEAQVVAANVDTVFVVSPLDRPLNGRALERYVAAVWEGGAEPVVVLTKADLVADEDAHLADAMAAAPGVDVRAVTAPTGRGLAALERHLGPRRTIALVGTSGAGKSTLVNALLGPDAEDVQAVGHVRGGDSKGRHTTTFRRLLPLPGGALLVDTPGMRELALWDADEGVERAFPEIEELAARCRFGDCRHEDEPGCAVLAAVAEGALPVERLESRRKLERELAFLHAKQDARARSERRKEWAKLNRSYRKRPRRGFR